MPKEALFHFREVGKQREWGTTKKPFSHNAIVNKHQEKKKKKMNAHEKNQWFPYPIPTLVSPPLFFLFLSPRELGKVAEEGSFMFSHIERGKKIALGNFPFYKSGFFVVSGNAYTTHGFPVCYIKKVPPPLHDMAEP